MTNPTNDGAPEPASSPHTPYDQLVARLERALPVFGVTLSEEERSALLGCLSEIIQDLEGRGRRILSPRSGPLRVRRVRLAGLLPFPSPIPTPLVWDLDASTGKVVAITGDNGAGKSTLVESPLGAVFGRTPTRGAVDEFAADDQLPWAIGTDIETATGSWCVERRRRNAGVIQLGDKHPAAKGHNAVLSWVRSNVPAMSILQAGTYGVQRNRGSLMLLEPAPARDVILAHLGLDVYQAVAKAASDRSRDLERAEAEFAGRLAEIQGSAQAEEREEKTVTALLADLDRARAALAEARTRCEAIAPNLGDETAHARRVALLERELGSAEQRADGLAADIQNAEAELAEETSDIDALRAAALNARAAARSARVALDETMQRVTTSKDARLATLRVGVTELMGKRKDAPTLGQRLLTQDTATAQEILRIAKGIDDLRDLAEDAEAKAASADHALSMAAAPKARADISAKRSDLQDLHARIEALRAELEPLKQVPVVDLVEVRAARECFTEAQQSVATLEQRHAMSTARLEHARAAKQRLADQSAAAEQITYQRHLWDLLALAFGREGIQGQAVDEIGPAIAKHANALLEDAAEGRWVVDVESRRDGADDGRETFEIMVWDRQRESRWRYGRNLSPGEVGVVGEAIAGAFSMLVCEPFPHVAPTMVRDESAVHVGQSDMSTWLAVLRLEAERIGASKVFVVSHDPRLIAACDSVLLVKDGFVREPPKEVTKGAE